jgi:hypothetical protein
LFVFDYLTKIQLFSNLPHIKTKNLKKYLFTMITISNYQTSLTPFTLTEKTTYPLSATTYILELYSNQLQGDTFLFLTGDTSLNIDRYNYYPINLTPYNLVEGTYDYKVWQTTGGTLSVSGLTTNDVVESGLATIIGSGTTTGTTYVLTGQTEYVFT